MRALLYLGCVRYNIRLRALLYEVACSAILGCVQHIFKYSNTLNVQLYVFQMHTFKGGVEGGCPVRSILGNYRIKVVVVL